MHKNKKYTFLLIFFSVFTVSLLTIPTKMLFAAETPGTGLQYKLLEQFPGITTADGSNLPKYIAAVYSLALAVIVLSALFMLSVGGFMYLTSAGNTSAMGTAKEVIFDSIIGLVIALTAWLLLNVINPDLVNVTLNGLSATPVVAPPGVPTRPPIVGACTGCINVEGVVPAKTPAQNGCKNPPGGKCQLNETFLNKLKNITGVSPEWWVTESWPPTVTHSSSCHSNGTCADINFQSGISDVNSVKALYTAIKSAGFNTVYETFNDCDPYTAAGVFCKYYKTTTGSHFHVY